MSPAASALATVWRLPALIVAALFGGVIATACAINWRDPRAVDFVSFWAAGRMTLGGQAAAAYDIAAHRAVELAAAPLTGLMPFPYPPPFLIVVAPFGALPYGAAFAAWIAITGALFVAAARAVMPLRIALAHPAVLANGLIGQTGFLTAGLFIAATRLLATRPLAAGALLGLLAIKPQLAILVPLALIAGGQWRAFAAAALSALAIAALALLLFGASAYAAFFRILPIYGEFLSTARWPWNELASAYALARYAGAPAPLAAALHAAIAIAAIAIVWRAWRADHPHKAAILACATILFPPYVMSYDAVVLALPLAALTALDRARWPVALAWGLSLLPLLNYFRRAETPNGIPLAAAIMLAVLWRRKG